MARISGVNIPTNKRIHVALTYIYGIGPKIADTICSEASIDITKRVNQLNDDLYILGTLLLTKGSQPKSLYLLPSLRMEILLL